MMEFFRTYRAKPWPKLEMPVLQRHHRVNLFLFMAGLMTIGWFIFLSPDTKVIYFALMGSAIPLLFLLKSRFVALIGLLSAEVILAFIFMGNVSYVVAVVAGIVGAIVAFESPILIYSLIIFWVWFEMSAVGGLVSHPLRLEFVIGLGFFVGWFFKDVLLAQTKPRRIYFPEKWPTLLFLVYAVAGFLMWSLEPIPAGWYQLRFLMIGVLFLLITPLVLKNEYFHSWAVWVWILAGVVGALTAIGTELTGFHPTVEASASWGAQTGALGIQHSWSASFLSFSFFIMLPMYYCLQGRLYKLLMFGALLLNFVAILIQQSKGPTVGLLVGLGLFIIIETFLRKQRSRLRTIARIVLVVFLLAGMLISVYYFHLDEAIGGYSSLFNNPASSSGMEIRLVLWATAYEMFSQEGHPIRGLGVGAFWALAFEYGLNYPDTVDSMDYADQGINPHSLYLDTILHYGVPGMLLFFWLALGNLWRLRRGFVRFMDRKMRYLCLGLFCGLMAFYFSCIFDFAVFIISRYWLFAGLSVATLNVGQMMDSTDNVY